MVDHRSFCWFQNDQKAVIKGKVGKLIKDGVDLGIGRTAAAPYYYSYKVIESIMTSDYNMSGGYNNFEQTKRELIRRVQSYNQLGLNSQDITKEIIEIEHAQQQIRSNLIKKRQEN